MQTEQHTGYSLEYVGADRAVAESLVPMIDRGRQTAELFFGTTYSAPFVVKIMHDRNALNARWRVAFQQPSLETRCWEVAGGWATEFDILSPAVWSSQACGHDGTNANHVANIVAHELVHVLHGQRNRVLLLDRRVDAVDPRRAGGLCLRTMGGGVRQRGPLYA